MGRPTLLDDLMSKRIRDAVRAGVSRAGAAHAAGIGYSTLRSWLARGRDDEQPYADFLAGLREAEAGAERELVDKLFECARNGHVGAMCFWLERRRYEHWGRRDAVARDDAPSVGQDDVTEETLESLLAAKRSKRAG